MHIKEIEYNEVVPFVTKKSELEDDASYCIVEYHRSWNDTPDDTHIWHTHGRHLREAWKEFGNAQFVTPKELAMDCLINNYANHAEKNIVYIVKVG